MSNPTRWSRFKARLALRLTRNKWNAKKAQAVKELVKSAVWGELGCRELTSRWLGVGRRGGASHLAWRFRKLCWAYSGPWGGGGGGWGGGAGFSFFFFRAWGCVATAAISVTRLAARLGGALQWESAARITARGH